jgi:hypothetical protein
VRESRRARIPPVRDFIREYGVIRTKDNSADISIPLSKRFISHDTDNISSIPEKIKHRGGIFARFQSGNLFLRGRSNGKQAKKPENNRFSGCKSGRGDYSMRNQRRQAGKTVVGTAVGSAVFQPQVLELKRELA